MKTEPKFLAHCGLYCGVCGVFYATRNNNEKYPECENRIFRGAKRCNQCGVAVDLD